MSREGSAKMIARKVRSSFLALLFLALLALPIAAPQAWAAGGLAAEDGSSLVAQTDTVAEGTYGTCPWTLDSQGTLTIFPGEFKKDPGWKDVIRAGIGGADIDDEVYGYRTDVKRIVFKAEGGDEVVVKSAFAAKFEFEDEEDGGIYTESRSWFASFPRLKSIDFSGVDTSKVKNMACMFDRCKSLESLDLSGLDTSRVTYMRGMFYGCESLESLDLSGLDTSRVTDMGSMFDGCESLESVNLSGFDTSNVTNLTAMFFECESLESLDLSGFDTSQVTFMGKMFFGCELLRSLDLSGFDTSQVTDMDWMFEGCKSLKSLDLTSFATSKVENTFSMFSGCKFLKSIVVGPGWSTKAVATGDDMFWSCEKLVGGNGTAYDAEKVGLERARVDKAGAPGYLTYKGKSSVKLSDWGRAYTGKAVKYAGKVKTTGSKGKVTFRYYSDKRCSKRVKAVDVRNAGIYYVRAWLAADDENGAAVSNIAKLTVNRAVQKIAAKNCSVTVKAKGSGASRALAKARIVNLKKKAAVSAKTKVSYAKGNKAGGKKIVVSKKTGKVTLKKGLEAGTYKVKVRLTAPKGKNYKAAKAKTITLTVKVK